MFRITHIHTCSCFFPRGDNLHRSARAVILEMRELYDDMRSRHTANIFADINTQIVRSNHDPERLRRDARDF